MVKWMATPIIMYLHSQDERRKSEGKKKRSAESEKRGERLVTVLEKFDSVTEHDHARRRPPCGWDSDKMGHRTADCAARREKL